MSDELYAQLQAVVGKEGKPVAGPGTVCKEMIKHWCEAMEDGNPMYNDAEYASQYGGVISPPMMVQTWTMPRLWPSGQSMFRDPGKGAITDKATSPQSEALDKLTRAGYTATLVTGSSFEFFADLHPGDTVDSVSMLSEVSPEKQTSRGAGYFLTSVRSVINQKGEVICKQSLTMFKFKPPQK